jgi:hypothetical protein
LNDVHIRDYLLDKYGRVLLRPSGTVGTRTQLDPDGYCHWGAMLYRASFWERRDVYAYVDARLREHRHAGAG